jgi:cell division protease FtsH
VGAELRNLVNEAALLAARKDRDAVHKDDFYNAMEKIVLGTERRLVMSPEDRKRVAYHESGHALLGLLLPEADPVHKVTIVPRGQALGVTYQVPLDDRHNYGERYLRGRITGALGGRAAEEMIFDAVSTGAENDLRQATNIARQMVTRWGMSDKVGLIYVARGNDDFLGTEGIMPEMGRETSEELASLVDDETRRILDECYVVARETLKRERSRLEALAAALLEKESLDEGEMLAVTGLTRASMGQPDHADAHAPAPLPGPTPTPVLEGAGANGTAADSPAAPTTAAPVPAPSNGTLTAESLFPPVNASAGSNGTNGTSGTNGTHPPNEARGTSGTPAPGETDAAAGGT